MSLTNPWLPQKSPAPVQPTRHEAMSPPITTGAVAPQPGQVWASDSAPRPGTAPAHSGQLWVTGVHGGAGESTVADLIGGYAGEQRWPTSDGTAAVLVVARTHGHGLIRLQETITLWAAGSLPEAHLLGAVLVPDAPGRPAAPLRPLIRVLAGGVPHLWQLDWHEEMRWGAAPRSTRRLTKVVNEITSVHTAMHNTSKENNR